MVRSDHPCLYPLAGQSLFSCLCRRLGTQLMTQWGPQCSGRSSTRLIASLDNQLPIRCATGCPPHPMLSLFPTVWPDQVPDQDASLDVWWLPRLLVHSASRVHIGEPPRLAAHQLVSLLPGRHSIPLANLDTNRPVRLRPHKLTAARAPWMPCFAFHLPAHLLPCRIATKWLRLDTRSCATVPTDLIIRLAAHAPTCVAPGVDAGPRRHPTGRMAPDFVPDVAMGLPAHPPARWLVSRAAGRVACERTCRCPRPYAAAPPGACTNPRLRLGIGRGASRRSGPRVHGGTRPTAGRLTGLAPGWWSSLSTGWAPGPRPSTGAGAREPRAQRGNRP